MKSRKRYDMTETYKLRIASLEAQLKIEQAKSARLLDALKTLRPKLDRWIGVDKTDIESIDNAIGKDS